MDVVTEGVAVILAGLSFILSAIGGSAAAKYRDLRLSLVSAGLTLIGVVGVLSVLHEISPRYGAPFAISTVPLLLLVVSVGLLYVALVRGSPRRPVP